MNWKKKLLESFDLYAVTDLQRGDPDFLRKAEGALKGGVDILQLRSKTLNDLELTRLGFKLLRLTRKYRRLLIVNDRVDILQALDADGVHLGQDDMPVSIARRILDNPLKIIGKSTHSLAQALDAGEEGVDYIGLGPVFSTPTKPDYGPVGLDPIAEVDRKVRLPFVAIGGIDESNLAKVLKAGARRVAVVRGIFGQENTYEAAKRLKTILAHHAMPLLQV